MEVEEEEERRRKARMLTFGEFGSLHSNIAARVPRCLGAWRSAASYFRHQSSRWPKLFFFSDRFCSWPSITHPPPSSSSSSHYEWSRQNVPASPCALMSVQSDQGDGLPILSLSPHHLCCCPVNGFRSTTAQGCPNGPVPKCRQILDEEEPLR